MGVGALRFLGPKRMAFVLCVAICLLGRVPVYANIGGYMQVASATTSHLWTMATDLEEPVADLVTLSVYGGTARVLALAGPGVYKADAPITATVIASHKHWVLTISGETPVLEVEGQGYGEEPLSISLEDISLEITRMNGTIQIVDLAKTVRLMPQAASEEFKISVRARTHWETIAGDYRGSIVFTVSPTQ
ncbi:MAG: hypothetical protein GX322_00790 [Firmicutes bacterium]|nr:hypothetical protein [Bacillota bacterium]